MGYPFVSDDNRRAAAFTAEVIQTFILVTVVLNTATTKAQADNSYYGVAIGFVVLSGALVIGGVSGACFNPAIAMLALLHGDYDDMWVFIFGPIVGAVWAGLLFRLTNPSEWDDSDPIARLTKAHHNPDGNLTRLAAMLSMEMFGAFAISWTVALSINAEPYEQFLAIGCIVCAIVYAGGAISGAHYNPCVTVGVYIRGLLESPQIMRSVDVAFYVCAQVIFCAYNVYLIE